MGFPGGTSGKKKNLPASIGDVRDVGFHPWVGKISWRRAWQPTPVFLSGESHGQSSLVGYSLLLLLLLLSCFSHVRLCVTP